MYESYFEKLRDECFLRNRTQNTADAYIRNIESFLSYTGKHPEELTLDDARNYLINKKKAKAAAATCNYYPSSLRFFYKFVLGKDSDGDYVPRMRREYHQPEVLTLEEVERLIDTAKEPRNKALIALIYSSGLRVGEGIHLAPTDIYMSTMQVQVRESKNHSDRWTMLSQRALDLLITGILAVFLERNFLYPCLPPILHLTNQVLRS